VEILSPYILAGGFAWLIAQGLKYLIVSIKAKNVRQFRQLYLSGNMPSAHSATVIALVTTIGLIDGTDTAVFALALTFAAVVMYDAVMVRRSSGEQGAAILAFFKEVKTKITPPRVAKGHSPLEVVAGAGLGVLVGVVVFLATTI
jgi:uncharacterized protein